MSKVNTEKKNAITRKLFLNRESLRILSPERLEEVAGGYSGGTIVSWLIGCQTD